MSSRGSKAKGSGAGVRALYADTNGNTWAGRGKRPQWLREALEAGRSLDEFSTGKAAKKARVRGAASSKPVASKKRKGAGKAKYGNGTQSWSGFGPQPKWLKEAIAGGSSLDDFRL